MVLDQIDSNPNFVGRFKKDLKQYIIIYVISVICIPLF